MSNLTICCWLNLKPSDSDGSALLFALQALQSRLNSRSQLSLWPLTMVGGKTWPGAARRSAQGEGGTSQEPTEIEGEGGRGRERRETETAIAIERKRERDGNRKRI